MWKFGSSSQRMDIKGKLLQVAPRQIFVRVCAEAVSNICQRNLAIRHALASHRAGVLTVICALVKLLAFAAGDKLSPVKARIECGGRDLHKLDPGHFHGNRVAIFKGTDIFAIL